MRILYVASDQVVPGDTGGSVHVLEVARGLAARGHEVHAVVRAQEGAPAREERFGVVWHRVRWWPPHRLFRFRAQPAVEAVAARTRPQVVMERYYNFGGEGIGTAAGRGLPSLLEVNSPVVDHRGSLKAALDLLAVVRPMRRHREGLCREATAIVSPLVSIVPEFARERTHGVSWGANVEAFAPARRDAAVRRELGVPEGAVAAVFSGSFRPWHGVHVLEEAARALSATHPELFFLLVGGESAPARGYRGRRIGRVPYERMPEIVAAADVGVAPYDTRRLRQLRLGFYWSPLKVFEYMASGLPTVTIPRAPLSEIVRDGEEGLHFREADATDLARALARLAGDPGLRARLGESARARVVERYSWARHCEQLESVLAGLLS
ncbi:MAG TPA: glycosyltransferase family 4 protein [Vicinamibacteria bacterium]|nr:glycosyltransferase family 4 protein [Vicinamibacteria bacterium]